MDWLLHTSLLYNVTIQKWCLSRETVSNLDNIYKVDSRGWHLPLTPVSISRSERHLHHIQDWEMYSSRKSRTAQGFPHVPLPPAIWPMSYASVSKLSICAHWWERTATLLQPLPWCRESCCSTIWKVEHHHQLPGLAIGMKPFVTHGLAPMAYGMHHLLKGLNPILLKEPSTEIIYLSCKLYTIHYIYKIYTMPKFKFVTTCQLTS